MDRWAGPERRRRGETGDPLSVRTSHTGAEVTEEGGREQKDGGDERKRKEENQENKNYIRDRTEEEWDEELKSIYLLFFFFVVFCFPRVHFMSYSPKVVFFLF